MTLVLLVLLAALVFEYINGFHDTANAIATVVSTKVLTPRLAVMWAAVWNLVGALMGTAVAKTISSGLVDSSAVNTTTIFAALCGGIIWNIFTWWLGLPSSSSHALIGGLVGAALATSGGNWGVLIWDRPDPKLLAAKVTELLATGITKNEATEKASDLVAHIGLWPKVVKPMAGSPVLGFVGGAILMTLLIIALRKVAPRVVSAVFGKAQLISAGFMGWSHGTNDAQKTMGIITLALVAATKEGTLKDLPEWASFLRLPDSTDIPSWIIWTCAITMAAGTAAGGWRIIKTMGHKMVKMQPVHGFAAETTAATILYATGHFGIPVSTTHVISTSIMGVGAAKRFSAVKWGVVERIVWAWVLTIPMTALLGYGIERLMVSAK
jgi:PiT family inorganic phosphate transporter